MVLASQGPAGAGEEEEISTVVQNVRIAIAGLGLVGKRHAAALMQTPGLELAAAVDPSPEGQAHARELGVPAFSDLEALFAGQAVDGVLLATPTPLHVAQGLVCVENGCPVLVEKPISVTADEAEELNSAAEAAGVPLLVGHHRRYNPLIQKAHEVIAGGSIGEVRGVQATCWFYKPDHYFDAAPWRKKEGAGPISVNIVHDIDLIRYLCGEVASVRAQAAPSRRGFENEDVAAAVLTFENGAIGTISVSDSIVSPWSWEYTARENPVYPPVPESCYMIGGSHGALSIPDLRLWQHKNGAQDWWEPIAASSVPRDFSDPLVNQMEHFAAVICGKAQPLVTGREGAKTLQVIEAIQKSAKSGEVVEISRPDPADGRTQRKTA